MTAPKLVPNFDRPPVAIVIDRARERATRASAGAAEADLSDTDLAQWRAELLDPDGWSDILDQIGRTMRLAVALTDTDANILGPCHNPQPVWTLARQSTPSKPRPPEEDAFPVCAFCLAPDSPCNAVRDALVSGEAVFADDRAGLAHMTIPLFLGHQRLGTLMAGQTFAQYPQPLALQGVAKTLGASQQELWRAAQHQVPISRATLRHDADLLASLGQAFLRQRYAAILDRKLHETNRRYRFLIEGSKDYGLLTVDDAGRVTSCNSGAELLLGYTESEITGRDYSRLFTQEDVQQGAPQSDIRFSEMHGRHQREGWLVRRDGTRFLSETVTARLGAGNGCEYGILLHDVTEARQTAETVLQAQKLESIGVLAGGIAHDFNNLLTGILGNVTLAIEALPPHHAIRPLLDIAEKSSLKGAALIAQLLSYVGKGDALVSRFDLSGLVAEILPMIQMSIPKTVSLKLALHSGLTWIEADAGSIQQIVMNLIINGAEAIGPDGGDLLVSTGVMDFDSAEGAENDGVYLEVRDSGCGMDEATQRRIFEPFFTTKFTGRGLGLAAVSGIVRSLKGHMRVDSAPGEGTTFHIVFPGVPTPPSPRAPQPARVDAPGSGVILVADDDPLIRELAQIMLKRSGYSVLLAENGLEAVNIFRAHEGTIKAVLMDLTMPVMAGGEALRLMHQIRPDVPVIISSGYGENAARLQFSGAMALVIRKPYTMSELRARIAEALAMAQAAKNPNFN